MDFQKKYFEITKTPYISMHINSMIEPIQNEDEAIQIIKENVDKLRKEFEKKILLGDCIVKMYTKEDKDGKYCLIR